MLIWEFSSSLSIKLVKIISNEGISLDQSSSSRRFFFSDWCASPYFSFIASENIFITFGRRIFSCESISCWSRVLSNTQVNSACWSTVKLFQLFGVSWPELGVDLTHFLTIWLDVIFFPGTPSETSKYLSIFFWVIQHRYLHFHAWALR